LGDVRNVRDAVIMGVERVGHGVLLRGDVVTLEVARRHYLTLGIETNIVSNLLLDVVPDAGHHPCLDFLRLGFAVSLSTDDAGILRIDLSHEYARAAKDGASYEDLKRSARNAIAFSFLAGEGLWSDPGAYARPHAACRGQIGQAEPRPGPCANLVRTSDKAREQWRHEALLARFEAARPLITGTSDGLSWPTADGFSANGAPS
jgi:adenosine deaminase